MVPFAEGSGLVCGYDRQLWSLDSPFSGAAMKIKTEMNWFFTWLSTSVGVLLVVWALHHDVRDMQLLSTAIVSAVVGSWLFWREP
jgi:hypothetical protein